VIVEFTGITSSGKTTISLMVIEKLKKAGVDLYCVHSKEFNIAGHMATLIQKDTLQNLYMDLVSLWYLGFNLKTYSRLLSFAYGVIRADKDVAFHKMNRFRSVCRKVGINHLVRQRGRSGLVTIIDEGIIHSIHNLFVQPYAVPDKSLIKEYSEMIQLPDIIVYVKPPKELLIERAFRRKDITRRVNRDSLIDFIKNAQEVFDIFMEIGIIKRRSFIVINDGGDIHKLSDEIVKHISGFLK